MNYENDLLFSYDELCTIRELIANQMEKIKNIHPDYIHDKKGKIMELTLIDSKIVLHLGKLLAA